MNALILLNSFAWLIWFSKIAPLGNLLPSLRTAKPKMEGSAETLQEVVSFQQKPFQPKAPQEC